jgi:hypothetical protein
LRIRCSRGDARFDSMNNVGKYLLLPTLLHISIAKRAAKAIEST